MKECNCEGRVTPEQREAVNDWAQGRRTLTQADVNAIAEAVAARLAIYRREEDREMRVRYAHLLTD